SPVPGSPAACARLISSARVAAHSGQVNRPRSCKASAIAKACASHGSRKTGPSASRGMLGTASAARRATVGSILLIHAGSRYGSDPTNAVLAGWAGARAPQLLALEHDGVEPLRVVALVDGHRVRKGVAAVHQFDHAETPACVARQAGVRGRMDVLRAHAIARLEAGRRLRLPVERAARHPLLDDVRRELARERLAAARRAAGRNLL